MVAIPFRDRQAAGGALADALAERLGAHDEVVVLALPRGGVPVARPVADRLGAPLDVLVVRKLGAPTNPEYGVGAIGEGDVEVIDATAIGALGLDRADLDPVVARERDELARRVVRYRGGSEPVTLRDRTVVIVDDGLATGVTAAAAVQVVRAQQPRTVIVAVPVGSQQAVARLTEDADDVVCLHAPAHFVAVGGWYRHFDQVDDQEVQRLLNVS